MNRVEQYMEDWYNWSIKKYTTLETEIINIKAMKENFDRLQLKLLVESLANINNKEVENILKNESNKINEINIKIDEKEKELEHLKVYLTEDFSCTFECLKYLDELIEKDTDLKAVIMFLMGEINEYAKSTKNRKDYNDGINKQNQEREYKQKLKCIDIILSDLPPLLGGFHMAFKGLSTNEDLELRHNLLEYKKKLEDNKTKSKHKDNDYYRNRLRLIMNNIHSLYKIDKHKKEIDDFIKGLRPKSFE